MAITQYSEIQTAVENWLATTAYTARTNEFIAAGEQRINLSVRLRAMEAHLDIVLRAAIAITAANLGGTANAITATSGSSLTVLLLGHRFTFTAEATNTGATTFNVDSLGATNVQKYTAGSVVALEANDIVNGLDYEIVYDGTRYLLCPRAGYPLPSRYVALRRLFLDGDPRRKPEFIAPEEFWDRYKKSGVGPPSIFTVEGDYLIFSPSFDTTYSGKLLYYRAFAAMSAAADTNWLVTNAGMLYVYAALVEATPFIGANDQAAVWATQYDSLLAVSYTHLTLPTTPYV